MNRPEFFWRLRVFRGAPHFHILKSVAVIKIFHKKGSLRKLLRLGGLCIL
jgi:hypothetical protein